MNIPGFRSWRGFGTRTSARACRVASWKTGAIRSIVPESARTKRADRTGVFVVRDDGRSVAWRDVAVGIRDGGRVQVSGEGLSGRVVTLGQQLVDDGSPVSIPDPATASPAGAQAPTR